MGLQPSCRTDDPADLNPADLHIISGEMRMMFPVKQTFAIGIDGAGMMENDGARFSRGQRVMFYNGLIHCGTITERISVPEVWLSKATGLASRINGPNIKPSRILDRSLGVLQNQKFFTRDILWYPLCLELC